jgi:hypothetical protein
VYSGEWEERMTQLNNPIEDNQEALRRIKEAA